MSPSVRTRAPRAAAGDAPPSIASTLVPITSTTARSPTRPTSWISAQMGHFFRAHLHARSLSTDTCHMAFQPCLARVRNQQRTRFDAWSSWGPDPETIKMLPVVQALRQSSLLQPFVVNTGQHAGHGPAHPEAAGITPTSTCRSAGRTTPSTVWCAIAWMPSISCSPICAAARNGATDRDCSVPLSTRAVRIRPDAGARGHDVGHVRRIGIHRMQTSGDPCRSRSAHP